MAIKSKTLLVNFSANFLAIFIGDIVFYVIHPIKEVTSAKYAVILALARWHYK
jgi:hypothetical protein